MLLYLEKGSTKKSKLFGIYLFNLKFSNQDSGRRSVYEKYDKQVFEGVESLALEIRELEKAIKVVATKIISIDEPNFKCSNSYIQSFVDRTYGKKGEIKKWKLFGLNSDFIIDLKEKLSKMKSKSAFKEKKSMNVVQTIPIEKMDLNETINSQKHSEPDSNESNKKNFNLDFQVNESVIDAQIDETLAKTPISPTSSKDYDFFGNESQDGGFDQNYE